MYYLLTYVALRPSPEEKEYNWKEGGDEVKEWLPGGHKCDPTDRGIKFYLFKLSFFHQAYKEASGGSMSDGDDPEISGQNSNSR